MTQYSVTESGKEYIRGHEGWRSKPYLCSAGVPTIGFGNTFYPNGKKVTLRDKPITKEYGIELFDFVIGLFEKDVNSLLKDGLKLRSNQFDMICSIAYNIGSDIDADDIPEGLGDSTLLKKINANPNDPLIEKEWNKWVRANGKISNGLVKRRKSEYKIYTTP